MKRFMLITALLALIGISNATNIEDRISNPTDTRISVSVSDLLYQNPKQAVVSFTLNKKGIEFLQSWRGSEDNDSVRAIIANLSDGTNSYGVGLFPTVGAVLPSTTKTVRKGNFDLVKDKAIGGVTGRTATNTCKDDYDFVNFASDNDTTKANRPQDLSAVAITLTNIGTPQLTISAKYSGGEVRVLETSKATIPVEFSLSMLELNADFVELSSIDVSNAFGAGETAQSRNAKLLVPEPATATLSLLALVGFTYRRRRQ